MQMCSRFEIDGESDHFEERFDLTVPPDYMPAPEVRPTNRVPIIEPGRRAVMRRWGLEVSWNTKPMINARAETLAERKTFMSLLNNRCMVPASAYFEWRKDENGKAKMRIARRDGDVFAFAGLYDDDRFTIITCAPSPEIAHIHGRMPVILEPEAEAPWLEAASFEEVAELLKPYPGNQLEATNADPPPAQRRLL